MNGSQTYQRLTRESLEEHQQIHFFLDRLAGSLERLRQQPPDVEPMRNLAAEIESLSERLKEHFAREEEGGLYQAILDSAAESAHEVRRLADQHTRMLEILEMARIHAQRGDASDAEPLREDLSGFLEVMREHERVEEALLKRAFNRENRSV